MGRTSISPYKQKPSTNLRYIILLVIPTMVIFAGLFSPKIPAGTSPANIQHTTASLESRLRSALWSYFAGDALAAPTHWYYGGFPQIQRDYGKQGIVDYTKPVYRLPGSIMNKSNLNGGGRSNGSSGKPDGPTIIGGVINHGKEKLWDPSDQIHYHATLAKGENTLEVQLGRVLMKSIVDHGGEFDADDFQQSYIKFMTTPGSHNDAYASTCHRMFFRNLIHRKLPPKDCPDNDQHNVDTVDGLILPTLVALAGAAKGDSLEDVHRDVVSCVKTTRNSAPLEKSAKEWTTLIYNTLRGDVPIAQSLDNTASSLGFRKPSGRKPDEITACYLSSALPALLDSVAKYSGLSVWDGLLANANTGGENVHRGSCLGAALGAQKGLDDLETQLVDGLYDRDALTMEIDAFVDVLLGKSSEK